MARSLILVRHPPVAKAWAGRCYGQSDMGLSRQGQAMLRALVGELAALRPDAVIHSDMRRTRAVALPLARCLNIAPIAAPLWQERHFGAWEGRTWNAIYRATGNLMDGMINDPHGFHPGATGETTGALIARTCRALEQLPVLERIVLISHGGPIAVARMVLTGDEITNLASQIIPQGTFEELVI
jgi:broad specificity phosphatase PhoE